MDTDYLTCPLCGFEFEKDDTLCSHGCPLGRLCHLIRCPSCEYEFPKMPQSLSLLGRAFRKRSAGRTHLPERVHTLKDLRGGERGRVLCLGRVSSRRNSLAVFGLVPEAEITLVQQQPACVVRVGETELALDADIARDILVERLG